MKLPQLLLITALFTPATAEPLLASAERTQDEKTERLTEWPEEPDGLKKELSRLRKAGTEVMATEAHHALVAMGAGVSPPLLKALGKERKEDGRQRIVDVLNAVLDARHTRLMAEQFEHDSGHVRGFALALVSQYPDPVLNAACETALTRAREAREKAQAKGRELPEEERGESLQAALACLSTGSLAGMDETLEAARSTWKEHGKAIRKASESARGEEAEKLLVDSLHSEDRKQRLAGLRLMAGLGTEKGTRHVAPFLDNSDNNLRIAAINALRGMIDGEEPIDKLPVFQAIEVAKKWKERL